MLGSPSLVTKWMLVLLACLFQWTQGYTVKLRTYQSDCYNENIKAEGYYSVSYEVANNENIDFMVTGPDGRAVHSILTQGSGFYDFPNNKNPGRYLYCFMNPANSPTEKTVHFHVHGFDPDDLLPIEEKASPLEKEVIHLAQSVERILDHQDYMIVREGEHRNTAESTNSRVKWWSAIQILLVCGVCAWQIWYLKSFFEVKRVV
ncbi:p24 complex component [Dispira parvispora]|uniref:P24 complex component n=1 Tax=Dispira parvispora TaxID=1520584 RepID=A0A9W8AM52_9FUNG|nr:p24 complex component [Dispira parvispora]